jgi:hypothetical protein
VYNSHIKALENLISIHPNLVELVASGNTKPAKVRANTRILGKEFSGVNSRDKIGYVRRKMEEEKCDCYVMTALDEIAYLLNSTHFLYFLLMVVRGDELSYNPYVFTFLVFLPDEIFLFHDDPDFWHVATSFAAAKLM